MIETLKKYLVQNWWIPLLFFIISIFLFLSDIILPNSGFSSYILITAGLILLVSSISQFFVGSKIIGVLQLSALIIPTLLFGYMIYIFSIMLDKPDSELSEKRIQPLIKDKTDLVLPKDYKILNNLIQHTEGAFDSDYSIELIIEYHDSDEEYITEQIIKSELYNLTKTSNYTDPIWTEINDRTEKGIWTKKNNGFEFLNCDNDKNRYEPFYIEIDTLTNRIELNLSHL